MRSPTPTIIEFRGAFYCIADSDDEFVQEVVLKKLKEKGLDLPEEILRGPEETGEQYIPELTPKDIEETTEEVTAVTQAARAHAEGLLQTNGIDYDPDIIYSVNFPELSEDRGFVVEGEEGVEVRFKVNKGNLSHFDGSACIFDYRFPESIWSQVRDRLLGRGRITPGGHELVEFIFQFCNHNFGVSAQKGALFDELIAAIGFVQDPSKVKTDASRRLEPVGGTLEERQEQVLDWLKEIIQEENQRGKGERTNWNNEGSVLSTLKFYRGEKFISKEQYDEILNWLDTDFRSIMDAAVARAQGSGGGAAESGGGLVKTVEEYVKDLAGQAGYNGPIHSYIDKNTGLIASQIEAPYRFVYFLERQAGGNVKLVRASMRFCDYDYSVDDPADAVELLKHDVTFGMAYKNAVNPKKSKRYRKKSFEDHVRDYVSQQAKQMQEQAGGEVEEPIV